MTIVVSVMAVSDVVTMVSSLLSSLFLSRWLVLSPIPKLWSEHHVGLLSAIELLLGLFSLRGLSNLSTDEALWASLKVSISLSELSLMWMSLVSFDDGSHVLTVTVEEHNQAQKTKEENALLEHSLGETSRVVSKKSLSALAHNQSVEGDEEHAK